MQLISDLSDVYMKSLNVETALVDGNYPASGSYLFVGDCTLFGWLIQAGALDDALTFQVKQDTSATQTGSIKDVTDAVKIVGATGDGKWYLIQVDPQALDMNNDFCYVTLNLSGATGLDDFAAILFFKFSDVKPPTQPS